MANAFSMSVRAVLQPIETFNRLQRGGSVFAILEGSSRIIEANLKKRFLEERDPSGRKWVQSEAAKRRKSGAIGSFGRRGGTLFDTGQLFASIGISKFGGEFTRSFLRRVGVTSQNGVLRDDGESNFKIGRKHQGGQDGLPVREFIGVSAQDVRDVEDFLDTIGLKQLNLD